VNGFQNSDSCPEIMRHGTHVGREHRQGSVSAVGVMAYARVAAHISPADAETAKFGVNPALSRNCDAPRLGMSQVYRSALNGRQPSEEGQFVRQPPPASFFADAEVFS
jgi:hypothetical protein